MRLETLVHRLQELAAVVDEMVFAAPVQSKTYLDLAELAQSLECALDCCHEIEQGADS